MDTESPLAVAQWRVAEAETRVKAQAVRVTDLASKGQDTVQARAALAVFETSLRFMQEDLIRLQEQAAGKQEGSAQSIPMRRSP